MCVTTFTCPLAKEGYEILGEALAKHENITELDLSKNFFKGTVPFAGANGWKGSELRSDFPRFRNKSEPQKRVSW